jgi:hypothetical protein
MVVSVEMVKEGRMHVDEALSQPVAPHIALCVHVAPAASQVSTLLPLQRCAPGEQPPVHSPAEHETVQLDDHSHAEPAELQISTAFTLQR